MKETIKNLKFTWKYAKYEKSRIIKFILCNIVGIIISVIIPILSSYIIISLTQNNFYQIILIALVIFIVENFRSIIAYLNKYYSHVIYRKTFVRIQVDLGSQILRLENKTLDSKSSGLFIQRLTNDTSRLADVFNTIILNLSNIITDIGIFVAIFIINKIVFLYIFVMTIVLYFVERTRVKKYNENDKNYRKVQEKTAGFVGEIVRGSRDIKMLNAETSFINELKKKIIDLNANRYKMQKTDRIYRLFRGFVMDLTELLLICLLVLLMMYNSLMVASALIIHNYSQKVNAIVSYFGSLLESMKDFNLSSSRIFEIIYSDKYEKETFGEKNIGKAKGDFEFKNVTFGYNKKKVLKDLSFKINANETVGFVGKSGAGKTTIFNLLCKMYKVDSGEITIDGVNINELDKESVRGNMTIISQTPYIFNLSIKENLRLVKSDLTKKEMIDACKLACLHDFIMTLPNKYDTIVGEGGITLSGGQKQRLAIARALIQKTEIILFDEATSALDNETQANIQKAIENMKNDYTILIIAHRLSTIINCDRILFLDDGKIVDEGTHEQLLKKNKKYKELYELELMKDTL